MSYSRRTKHFLCRVAICLMCLQSVFIPIEKAHAFAVPLAAVAVGAVIAATGVMVAGAGVYKPPTFAQANAAVDSVTGDITRKVVVAKAFADGVSSGMRGYQGKYVIDFAKAAQWAKDHAPSFPLLAPAYNSALQYAPFVPAVGDVYGSSDGIYRKIITKYGAQVHHTLYGYTLALAYAAYPYDLGGCRVSGLPWTRLCWNFQTSGTNVTFDYQDYTVQVVYEPITYHPSTYNPSAFAAAYPNTQAGQDETDKIAGDNPASVKAAPAPFTDEQVAGAQAATKADISSAASTTAAAAAAANPTDTNLQVAASQAATVAAQDKANAIAEQAKVETKADDSPPAVPGQPAAPTFPAIPTVPTLDFAGPIKTGMDGLTANIGTKEPFATFKTLPNLLTNLTATPVAPVIDVEFPFAGQYHIDLSCWNTAASILRAGLAIVAMTGLTFFVIKVWV